MTRHADFQAATPLARVKNPVELRRILYLADANSIHTARLANGLNKRGVEVRILSMRPPHGQPYASGIRVGGVFRDRALTRFETLRFIFLANWWRLVWRPQIVHAHYCSSYGILSRHVLACRRVISVWGTDLLVRVTRNTRIRKSARRAFAKAHAIFCTSDMLAQEAAEHTITQIFRTPYGVDVQLFSPDGPIHPALAAKRATLPNLQIIGCTKWLSQTYGPDILVAAFAKLKMRRPDLTLLLVLTGNGSEQDAIISQAKELGISDHLMMTGNIDHDEIPSILRGLDLAVYPSRSESFGVSILEASACERPVLASRVGGLSETVREGETGALITPEDPYELADAMERYLDNPQMCSDQGRAGRKFVKQSYDWSVNLDKIEQLYQWIIAGLDISHLVDQSPDMPSRTPFRIFHYPFELEAESNAARPIRVRNMRRELAALGDTVTVMGRDLERLRQMATVRYYHAIGRKAEAAYCETLALPTLSAHNLLRGNFIDYRFFDWLSRQNIPRGIFIRDIYVFEKSYYRVVGARLFYLRNLLQRMDLRAYARAFDLIFVPTQKFGERLKPYLRQKDFVPLPPARRAGDGPGLNNKSDRAVAQVQLGLTENKLNLVYIGGIGYHYDMRQLLAAVALRPATVHLDVICRPRDLDTERARVGVFLGAPNIRILHEDQSFFFHHARGWDAACLVRQPHDYIGMAYPVKLLDYASANLPILTSNGQFAAKVVTEKNLGRVMENRVVDILTEFDTLACDPKWAAAHYSGLRAFKDENLWSKRMQFALQMIEKVAKDRE